MSRFSQLVFAFSDTILACPKHACQLGVVRTSTCFFRTIAVLSRHPLQISEQSEGSVLRELALLHPNWPSIDRRESSA